VPWSLLLTSLAGVAQGEIGNASGRTLDFPLNRLATGAFKVRLTHPLAELLLAGDALVKVYQQEGTGPQTLRMVGEIVSVEEVASETDAGSLAVTFAEAGLWRLTHRLIGKSGAGVSYGTAIGPVDRGSMASSIIAAVNADGDTGVRVGTITVSASGYVGPWYYKPASEAISELSNTLDGYDFRFDPLEPVADGAGVTVARFTAAGALGTTRPDTIFEFGTGRRNIKSLKRQVSRDGLLNLGYHLPPGFPETLEPVESSQDLPSITARGLHEGVVTSDLAVAPLRAALVQEHVQVRKAARQIITFEPTGYDDTFNVDYSVGDVVTARARIGGSNRFNALFRIYGVSATISEEGAATYSLTLVNT